MTSVEEKQQLRVAVLNAAYDLSDGSRAIMLNSFDVAQRLGVKEDAIQDALRHLHSKGLVVIQGSGPGLAFTIEPAGVDLVERSRTSPGSERSHHPSPIVQVFTGPVGAVQSGPRSVAHVVQHSGLDPDALLGLVEALRRAIPPEAVELQETVEDLAEEVAKPTPKKSKLRAYLGQARDLAKDIGPVVNLIAELAKAVS